MVLFDVFQLFFCVFRPSLKYFNDLLVVLWSLIGASKDKSYRSLLPLPLVAMFDPFVAIEGARLRERLRADVALVWLGPAVNPQVYKEVQFLVSCHAAARVLAVIVRLVSFGPLVKNLVD